MIPADLHAHTIASGHAFSTLDEMVRAAAALGRRAQGLTDHGPSMDGAPTIGYFEMVGRLPRTLHGVDVLMGCEAAIVDVQGRIDLPAEVAQVQRVLLAGLHARTPFPTDLTARQNTDALIGAMESPWVDIVSHPYRDGFPVEPRVVAEAAAAFDTLLEVNVAALWRSGNHPGELATTPAVAGTREMLQHLMHCGGGFVVSSDAHHAAELAVGDAVLDGLGEALGVHMSAATNASPPALESLLERLRRTELPAP